MRRQRVRKRFAAFDPPQNIRNDTPELLFRRQVRRDRERPIQRHSGIKQRRKLLRKEEDIAALIRSEGRKTESNPFLPRVRAHIYRRETLPLQFARHRTRTLGRDNAGPQFSIGRNRAVVKCRAPLRRRRHQNSCVTRVTSDAVVSPSATFFQPSSRRFVMPSRRAHSVSWPESALAMMSCRSSSFSSISSKIPARPRKPEPLHASQPRPANVSIRSPDGVISEPAL